MAQGADDQAAHHCAVAEPHFGFRRMDIDVDLGGVDVDGHEGQGIRPGVVLAPVAHHETQAHPSVGALTSQPHSGFRGDRVQEGIAGSAELGDPSVPLVGFELDRDRRNHDVAVSGTRGDGPVGAQHNSWRYSAG